MDISPTQERTNRRMLRFLYLSVIVVLCIGSFMAGVTTMWFVANRDVISAAGSTSSPRPTLEATPSLTRAQGARLLEDIYDILESEYIDASALDNAKLYYGAAAGLVAAIGDRNTTFQEPIIASYEAERMEGAFEGIGATVEMREGAVTIAVPLPGSPALKAGLLAGDVILAVDGKPVDGLSLTEVVTMIRGPRGSRVRLLIKRAGSDEPFEIEVTRDRIEMETVSSRMLDGNIAYVKLSVFNAVATRQLTEALDTLLRQKPRGLVFDLRGNPGGYLTTAIEVASQFLPRNTLVITEIRRDEPVEEFRVRSAGSATKIPLVILIDGGSASASEIVAGAVQDHGRGTIVGMQSYGKGSVQATHEMVNGSSLRVTIARWFRPDGTNIDGNGITPDIIVEMTQEDVEAGRDPQLERAIQVLQGQ